MTATRNSRVRKVNTRRVFAEDLLDGPPDDRHPVPTPPHMPDFVPAAPAKEDKQNWDEIADRPGTYQLIDKLALEVDHRYQRDTISVPRVNTIAAHFSWIKFGALCVVRRPDGKFVVVDGQHRLLAARKRASLSKLPCLVFETQGGVAEEAGDFVDCNSMRTAVGAFNKYRAKLVAKNPVALAIDAMVRAENYEVTQFQGAGRRVLCIRQIERCYLADEQACRAAWKAAAHVAGGEPPKDRLVGGLFSLERHLRRHKLGSVTDGSRLEALRRLGQEQLMARINATIALIGKSGNRAWGQGIALALNYRKKTDKIPSLYSDVSID